MEYDLMNGETVFTLADLRRATADLPGDMPVRLSTRWTSSNSEVELDVMTQDGVLLFF